MNLDERQRQLLESELVDCFEESNRRPCPYRFAEAMVSDVIIELGNMSQDDVKASSGMEKSIRIHTAYTTQDWKETFDFEVLLYLCENGNAIIDEVHRLKRCPWGVCDR